MDKKPGDEVFAGTQNLTGVLEIRVSRAGQDTTLGRVRELILAAEKTKLPIMRIVDQYMVYYTPLVLVIGALVWAFTHDLEQRHFRAGRRLPLRLHSRDSHRHGRRSFRGRAPWHFDQERRRISKLAARINAFIFDKTGTLTTGKLAVSRLAPAERHCAR